MDENAYGTPRFLRAVHAGLHNKYLVHCEKVEELWRSFTPSQREQVFRAGLRGNQVLKDPHDQSLGRSYTVISEMNLRDIAGSPDHFLDHFEFRATTSLMEQYRTGLEGALGDHQVVMQSMIAENTEFDREYDNQLTFFVDEERYGESFQAESRERYKQVLDDFESAVRAGLCVPRGVGQLILERQCYLIKHLCILVEDVLNLGVIIDESQTQSMTPTEEARIALSTYPAEVYPEPVCVQDLLTAIYDRKTSFEAYWGLVRSNPVFLASAVDVWYSTRPDLVPDEKGRRMPLVSDEYVSRAIFEVIHNSVIGTAIWDILFALLKNFLEASDDPEQSIILQEISNICNYEYDRIRKDFKRIVQVGIGCKHFKRLSNVFDSATPRVTLKGIPDRLQKEDPQLHYILRLCQSENGASQAVRWITMLDQLHHKQPLEQDRLEEREYDALGEIAMTVNLVNALIVSLELPSASPKKGLTYISKLKELMARLDPLKAHTNLRRLSVSIDDIKKPDMAKEALSIVDRFSEYYAGGPMVPLYQALNKEYLEDLEAQMQEAKATQKTKTKHSSTKSVGDSHPMSETRRQGQGHKTHSSHSSRSTNRRASASEPEVSAQSRTPIRLESPANSETRAKLETPIKADESTNTSTPTQVEEVEVLEVLPRAKKPTQPQIAESETLAEPEAATTSPRSEELVASAQAETSTEPEPEISSRASISVEFETSAKPSLSSGSEISANPKSLTESVTPVQPETTEVKQTSQPEMSGEPEIAAEVEESTETAATSEHELLVAPDPYAQLTTSAVMQASSALKAGEIEPHSSHQPETPAELQTNTEHGTNEPEQTTVKPETTGPEVSAEVETSEALGEPGPDLYAASKTTKPEPSNQVDISPESGLCTEPQMFESDPSIKAEMEPPIVPDTSTKSEITEVIPEVFKVQPSTLAVFSTLFSEPESESNSSDAAAPAPSIKWLAFGAAMVEIGFTIVPNIGSLYTFVPGDNAESHAFFTLHRPYREVLQGASLVHLASRLKKLYGWGRESFEAL